ncbi:solute carrier family 51 subunit beta isoform X2 [Scyliorhinus canicula]|uniref:solute carrier family 51 subunit beta isoform X2 n=1 Tax=Scyliorhinus canicula TaxID=7830 RepID=UPI0018F6C923|nr:solute carrier family 51 subunit beta isoform X2 [Scyliorhinus canicula]
MFELKRDPFGWLILCVLLQGVQDFIIKNSGNKCLEASLEGNQVLTVKCNPDSLLQDWVWKQNRLFNQGSRRCLSAGQTLIVKTAACENTIGLTWICTKRRLVHVARTMYLIADENIVFISKERKKNSKWSSMNVLRVQQEPTKCRKTEASKGNLEITLAKTQMLSTEFKEKVGGTISDVRQNETKMEETTTAKQLLHPMEDSTNWNYAMLALASIALFLGFLILALCSRANQKKKIKALSELENRNATASKPVQKMVAQPADKIGNSADEIDSSAETDQMLQANKQAYIFMDQAPYRSSPKISPKPGEIMIEWKDGNISSLFMDAKEDDV